MPFVPLVSVFRDVQLGGWRIEEPEHELLPRALLHPSELDRLGAIAHPSKRLEHLAARAALRQLHPATHTAPLVHGHKGEPILTNGHYVSLSHTASWGSAAYSAKRRVSVDTEHIRRAISPRMHHLFLRPAEQEWVASQPFTEAALLIWCAKESLYKLFSPDYEEISFARELEVPVAKLVRPSEGSTLEIVAHFTRDGKIHPVELAVQLQMNHLVAHSVNG